MPATQANRRIVAFSFLQFMWNIELFCFDCLFSPFVVSLLILRDMSECPVPSTSDQDGTDEKTRVDYKAPSETPKTETNGLKSKSLGIVMISHLSEPSNHFRDGDEGNPRNWAPKRKIGIALFVVIAGFMA